MKFSFVRFLNMQHVVENTKRLSTSDRAYGHAIKDLNLLQPKPIVTLEEKNRGLGLIIMKQFLDRVQISDEDIEKMRIIHVSGTKGKGSTCAFVESILRHSRVKTGFMSSPHLMEVRERFKVNGKPISRKLFTKYFYEVCDLLDQTKDFYHVKKPCYYSLLYLMGFYIFKHEAVESAIVEVGFGGAYDYTNIARRPAVCGVTSLGIDHVRMLGNTLESIAWHKSGIFKPNVAAFTLQQPPEAMTVLQERAKELGAHLSVVPDFNEYFKENEEIVLGIGGEHQKMNASLAVQLAHHWLHGPVTSVQLNQSFLDGLANCCWYGRGQVIKFDSMTLYLDGAHTKESLTFAGRWFIEEARKEQQNLSETCQRILVFNLTKDRDTKECLSQLLPCNFDAAVFSPNIISNGPLETHDGDNLTKSSSNLLDRAKENYDVWLKLCSSNQNTLSVVFPTIADVICWLSAQRESELFERSQALARKAPDVASLSGSKHLQVLVTGSLMLIGGCLTIIKPNLND